MTRAKNRVTLVSSFTSRDMDPDRSTAAGVQLLRQYLQYVESRGANLGDTVVDKPALNPFEVDVRDALSRAGLRLTAQYGSSGYWIDFVVAHPTQPGRYVLAIECDGASYHASESARDRDRLRQEQLERLGWRFHRIWSSEWFYNKETCVAKVLDAYTRAVDLVDRGEEPTPLRPAPVAIEETPRHKRVGARPIGRRDSIDDYHIWELKPFIQWIESDDLTRTEDELLAEASANSASSARARRSPQTCA